MHFNIYDKNISSFVCMYVCQCHAAARKPAQEEHAVLYVCVHVCVCVHAQLRLICRSRPVYVCVFVGKCTHMSCVVAFELLVSSSVFQQ
jgi:hypothetical protein